jgi:hypothetical protein
MPTQPVRPSVASLGAASLLQRRVAHALHARCCCTARDGGRADSMVRSPVAHVYSETCVCGKPCVCTIWRGARHPSHSHALTALTRASVSLRCVRCWRRRKSGCRRVAT